MSSLLTSVLLYFQVLSLGIVQQPQQSPPSVPQVKASQKPTQDQRDVVKITTNLVQVDAVITDRDGRRVTDLRQNEIEIMEDGRQQHITNFSYIPLDSSPTQIATKNLDRNAPPVPPIPLRRDQVHRTIALVVDDLGLSFESTVRVRKSLKKFVERELQPNDLVAIIRTGAGIGALQQFTTDKSQLYAAIERVKWNSNGTGGISSFAPWENDFTVPRANPDGSVKRVVADKEINQLREDVFAAGTLGALSYIVRGLRGLPGRKSVVLFSDGFRIFRPEDADLNERILSALRRLLDLANRASVVVYALDARGLQTLGATAAANRMPSAAEVANFLESQNSLIYLAEETGGLALTDSNDLAGGLKRIIADQEGYYLIGYRPDEATFDAVKGRAKFHHISLRIKRPGKYNVRVRNGFYGVSNEESQPVQTAQGQMLNVLTSPFNSSDIHLRLTSLFVNDEGAGSAVRSFMHVDARDLKFVEESEGVRKADFDVVAMTFGDNGQLIDQFGYTQTVRVNNENLSNVINNGFTYNMTVSIKKAGGYQLRTALRDKATERVGSASQFIEVPDIKKNKVVISGILMRGVPLNTYLKSVSLRNENQPVTDIETPAAAGPAVRLLQAGMALAYGFMIYNAQLDKLTGKPKLTIQVRVFRNGEQLYASNEMPYDAGDQVDLKRLTAGGGLKLGKAMTPGEYVLQVIVIDLAGSKPRVATRWIDFEIGN